MDAARAQAHPGARAVAMLVVTAGALAAGGVIQIGAPAEPHESSVLRTERWRDREGHRASAASLDRRPGRGAPWGMRVLSTKRGEGCVQVGRLLDGKLGAIGQDSAFHDDGLFHEFAVNTFGAERACTLLDGNDRLFLNAVVGDIPASAWRGNYPDKGCVPSTAGPYERFAEDGKRKPYPVCPQADERNLYYGLLGPDAKSVTYALDGQTHTLPTAGPEGAYLIVTKASPTQLFNFNAGGTQDVVPVDGPITELHYRDGATCHLTARSWIGGKYACTPELKVPVGWVPPRTPAPTAAQVASPLHVQLVRARGGGYEAILQFTSRVAISNARSSYTVEWHETGQPAQVHSFGPPNPRFRPPARPRRCAWVAGWAVACTAAHHRRSHLPRPERARQPRRSRRHHPAHRRTVQGGGALRPRNGRSDASGSNATREPGTKTTRFRAA